jgi:methionyl aminopeptidase
MIIRKTKEEIEKMRVAGQLVAAVLAELEGLIVPGISTGELDLIAESAIRRQGGVPSFKGYRGYPASACISINEQVVHGIPDDVTLKEGDIVGIDLGAIVNGWQGDSAITMPVGKVSPLAARLMKTTRESLFVGIAEARVGNHLSDISHAIQQYAEKRGFSVVRDLVGHGIGRSMHEDPQVPNFGKPGRGPILEAGMTLAIEPMLNAGGYQVESLSDGWTMVTRDRSLSAHFEHTVAITEDGPDILTLRLGERISEKAPQGLE